MTASEQQLSISFQRIPSKEIVFSNTFGSTQRTAGTHYIKGTGSLGRLKYHEKHKSLDASDEELEYTQLSQSTHILGRVKSERLLSFNSDENCRRRTIIVEKKNDSYGFTLQSYGIHYARDQEIETITYVDYVEYDGPAYRAGMREGDVILSINGIDMEKADHKTLVAFIKSCDTRMRMVVLFEDCVRKVELHMRYIQLQSMLQNKINELECINLRERELLEGKWKTHSLPARKKTISSPATDTIIGISPINATELSVYYRPTLSTEDVPNIARYHQYNQQTTIIPPPAQFRFTRHYARTPSCILKSSAKSISIASSGELDGHSSEYLQRSPSDNQHLNLIRTDSTDTATLTTRNNNIIDKQKQQQQPPQPPIRKKTQLQQKPIKLVENNNSSNCNKKKRVSSLKSTQNDNNIKSSSKYFHSHTCNPCIGNFRWSSTDKEAAYAAPSNGKNNGDNVSLDAYDLASPCCNTHCVPTRRRSRHQHEQQQHQNNIKVVVLQQTQNPKHQQQQHVHKHRESRPKSQSHIITNNQHQTHKKTQHHHHYAHYHQQQQKQHNDDDDNEHHISPKHEQHHHMHDSKHKLHTCGNNIRSQYIDLATGLMSYCSLHSRTSSEFSPVESNSYTTSLSTDTLFWEPKGEKKQQQQSESTATATAMSTQASSTMLFRQQSIKSRNIQHHDISDIPQPQQQQQSQHQPKQQQSIPIQISRPPASQVQSIYGGLYQHRYHISATHIQPSQICVNPMSHASTGFVQKPRSWDNLTTNAIGGFGIGYGYGYLDTAAAAASATVEYLGNDGEIDVGFIHPTLKLHIPQQRHSISRKNPYARRSAYATANVENYAPPPQQFVEEYTTTTRTTTILAKSTEHPSSLMNNQKPNNTKHINNNNQYNHKNNNSNKIINLNDQEKYQQEQQHAAFKMAQLKINQNQKFSHYSKCQMGYYSHLPRPTANVGTSTKTTSTTSKISNAPPTTISSAAAGTNNSINVKTRGDVTTVSEVTRL